LLFDRPLEFYFVALMQIEKDDKAMYDKIKNLTNDDITTITDANGFRMLLNKAQFAQGWITLDGNVVSRCADGQNPVADFFNKLLFCDIRRPIIELEKKPGMWWLWLVVGAGCAAIIVAVVVYRKTPRHAAKIRRAAAVTKRLYNEHAMFPARLQVPATVSFEYQLVPGNLI
jgi:hypothetical protein